MTPSNLTELRKANDNHTQTDRNTTGGISADVLPRGSVLSGTLEIRVLEQMPRRGNPAHSHFLPVLPSPAVRPRNLHQLPHTMKTAAKKSRDQVAEDFNNSLIQICRDYFGDECPMFEVQTKLNPDSTPSLIVISATGKRVRFSEIVSEFEKNKAQAAEERRKRESMEEKQAIRLALMSRRKPQEATR